MLIAKIISRSITADAYAFCWTCGRGVPSWKKIARGRDAVASKREVGIRSVYPAVNSMEAASPILFRKLLTHRSEGREEPVLKQLSEWSQGLVAPSEYDTSLSSWGTVFITSSIARVIMGSQQCKYEYSCRVMLSYENTSIP